MSCAKKEPPPGGPEDKIPPQIVSHKPFMGETSVGQEPEITVSFSERMKRVNVASNIRWRPMVKEFETQWRGNTLIIQPEDTLAQNQTYVVTITTISDYHNVKLEAPYTFAFSTGATLDSCQLSGEIYHESETKSNAIVRLYDKADTTEAPAYFTTSDKSGAYNMNYLKQGDYRLLAFLDENDNNEFDFGQEAGLDTSIVFSAADCKKYRYDLELAVTDTTAPILAEAIALDNTHVQIEFSEPMADDSLAAMNRYAITDTIGNTLLILSIMPGELEHQQILFLTESQDDSVYIIQADSTFQDSAGHVLGSNNFLRFRGSVHPDSIAPMVERFSPEINELVHTIVPKITVTFNEFMDLLSTEQAFSLRQTADDTEIKGEIRWQDATTFEFIPTNALGWVVQYTARVDTTARDAAGNYLKEPVEWKFLTVPPKR